MFSLATVVFFFFVQLFFWQFRVQRAATVSVDTTLSCTRAYAHLAAHVAEGLAAQVLRDSQNSVISPSCPC